MGQQVVAGMGFAPSKRGGPWWACLQTEWGEKFFMLTERQRAIVKSTVPLLEAGGEALTTHFYQLMLSESTEVQPLFNSVHQQTGAQPRALARSVLMYAKHIDDLSGLGDLPAQIIHKHVSLQVQPAHYPIVGAYLLRAIREVLGAEVATDEVIAAWGAAYGQLADILIGAEKSTYEANAQAPGGWLGARRFVVAAKQAETPEITSFTLHPEDGGAVLAYQPGQFIGLRVVVQGREQRRNYSLSQQADGRSLRISVKREAQGLVSNHLHAQVHEGDVLDVFPPAGHFTLDDSAKPLVLMGAGVGITPLMAMLQQALKTERPTTFIHCARSPAQQAFRSELLALAEQHPQLQLRFGYEQDADQVRVDGVEVAAGLPDAGLLQRWLPAERDVQAYYLGPLGFMRLAKRVLQQAGVPQAQARYEFFGPAEALEA
jgi:nitric oxide dioxygenase